MIRTETYPPVVWGSIAFAIGLALPLGSALPLPTPVLFLFALIGLIRLWTRPSIREAWILIGVAGALTTQASEFRGPKEDCLASFTDGDQVRARIRLDDPVAAGMMRVSVVADHPLPCDAAIWTLLPSSPSLVGSGSEFGVSGRIVSGRLGNFLRVAEVEALGGQTPRIAKIRSHVESKIESLFGDQGPLVSALILADKSDLDPELREDFTRSGTAHLLAISGFHVGILAGIFVVLARSLGRTHRNAGAWASLAVWLYVLFIGAPSAAVRASTLLTLFAVARLRGRVVLSSGALASAFLGMLVLKPEFISDIGFQLSFAGSWGLVSIGPKVRSFLGDRTRVRLSPGAISSVAAGVSTTVTTLPLVAWHFERISSVGIPATLAAGPLVAFVIPAILVTLLLSWVSTPAATFLAGGVTLLLELLVRTLSFFASLPGATISIAAITLGVGVLGAFSGRLAARRLRLGPTLRVVYTLVGILAAVLLEPIALATLQGRGAEIVVLDVGQGDAILFRSPDGRWALVDAGPKIRDRDAALTTILPYLRSRGVARLDFVVFTHPDLDHIGGAESLLESVSVGAVFGPAIPIGRSPYLTALRAARETRVGWWRAEPGDALDLGGMTFEWLAAGTGSPGEDSNETSVVLLLRVGSFRALFTGDASVEVENRLVEEGKIEPVDILKAGHHGSRTSTSQRFVDATRAPVAIVSAGRDNRFGHPHAEVTDRLEASGARILRTDRSGHIRIRIGFDGGYSIETSREESEPRESESSVGRNSFGSERRDLLDPRSVRGEIGTRRSGATGRRR